MYFSQAVSPVSALVCIPHTLFDQFGASQNNKLCGQKMQLTGPNGVSQVVVIADRNGPGTAPQAGESMDLTRDTFLAIGGNLTPNTQTDHSNIKITWKLLR
jgi:hypothetical protein